MNLCRFRVRLRLIYHVSSRLGLFTGIQVSSFDDELRVAAAAAPTGTAAGARRLPVVCLVRLGFESMVLSGVKRRNRRRPDAGGRPRPCLHHAMRAGGRRRLCQWAAPAGRLSAAGITVADRKTETRRIIESTQ
jgi:hypothetical protein